MSADLEVEVEGCYRASIQGKHADLLHLTFLLLENLFDPGKIFGYICVDVGNIWVVTVTSHVERHDTNSHPAAHQRTTRITL